MGKLTKFVRAILVEEENALPKPLKFLHPFLYNLFGYSIFFIGLIRYFLFRKETIQSFEELAKADKIIITMSGANKGEITDATQIRNILAELGNYKNKWYDGFWVLPSGDFNIKFYRDNDLVGLVDVGLRHIRYWQKIRALKKYQVNKIRRSVGLEEYY